MAKISTGMSKNFPGFAHDLTRVKPRDIDEEIQYCIIKPGCGTAAVVADTDGSAAAGTFAVNEPDYPRSIAVAWCDASGTTLVGTAIISGKNQFGDVISETFVNTSGGTTHVQGTKVFGYFGTCTLTHANGAAGDTITVGYGTALGTARFGLPNKVSGSADVKRVTWIDNGAAKPGTATIDTANQAILLGAHIEAADEYIITLRPNYTTDDDHQCKITNSALVTNA